MTRRRLSRRSIVALAACGVVALSLANPESAAAVDLFPIDNIVRGVIGGAASFTSDQVAGAAVASLLGVVKFLIGDLDKDFGKQMVGFLVGIPDYANPRHAAINRYADFTQSIAWGLLGLVLVGSALRYWAAGYCTTSAGDALMAFQRTAAAAAGLVVLQPAWHFATVGVNKLTWALMHGPGVGDAVNYVFISALSPVGMPTAPAPVFGGLVMLGMLACAIWLLMTKIVISAALAVLYLGAPIAIALGPLDDLGWVTGIVTRGAVAILVYPVVWSLCFVAFALLSSDIDPANGVIEPTIARFEGLAALLVAIRLPKMVLQRGLGYSPTARPTQMLVSIKRVAGA